MAKSTKMLSALSVNAISKPGYHADGDGLYLQVAKGGTKSWVYRYTKGGKRREMGLGPFSKVGLKDARAMLPDLHKQLAEGKDPIVERRANKAADAAALKQKTTFKECALKYIEAKRPGWKNAKHASQWENTLATYAYPRIGGKAISQVDREDILKILKQGDLWNKKTETASRLRGRLEKIFDAAIAARMYEDKNPAVWKGGLEGDLVSAIELLKEKKTHHGAMAYKDLPAFYAELMKVDTEVARALRLIILTASRTANVIGATWDEIKPEEESGKPTLATEKKGMKARKVHVVPLSDEAMSIIRSQETFKVEGKTFIFQGRDLTGNRPLSNMACLMLLKRMTSESEQFAKQRLTVHGFRSTFKDWAVEKTSHPHIISEKALAHRLGDDTVESYLRGNILEKRRALMDDWADYCLSATRSAKVVPIKRAQRSA